MDTRTRLDLPKLDLHVLPVYCRGVSGRGVRVTVLDDGVETDHEDLRDNYVSNTFSQVQLQNSHIFSILAGAT